MELLVMRAKMRPWVGWIAVVFGVIAGVVNIIQGDSLTDILWPFIAATWAGIYLLERVGAYEET